jgi:hypothetical protein
MQPLKLAPACLESRARDGSHKTRDKKPHHSSNYYSLVIIIRSSALNSKALYFFSYILYIPQPFFIAGLKIPPVKHTKIKS